MFVPPTVLQTKNLPFICLLSLCLLLFSSLSSSHTSDVHQCLARGCLSPWQWRRTIVAAVMSWPYADTSWTGTSSKFKLSTLPAMMLWVIRQSANEQSEVFGLYFLTKTKDGLCGECFLLSILFVLMLMCIAFCENTLLRWILAYPFLAALHIKQQSPAYDVMFANQTVILSNKHYLTQGSGAHPQTRSQSDHSAVLFCGFGPHFYLFW